MKFRAQSAIFPKLPRTPRSWYYGGIMVDGEEVWLCVKTEEKGVIAITVDPETVGQFTGLYDKNGKEIYEGDIVRYYDVIEDELVSSHVIYHTESCSFCAAPTKLCGDYIGICAHWQFEVIGNIYDTPELLKGG